MKTVILAGGYGSRLGSMTAAVPKPMVVLGNKPIIRHIMQIYSAHGFNEFVVSCGYRADIIKDYFLNFYTYDNDFNIDLASGAIDVHRKPGQPQWSVTICDTGINTLKAARIKSVAQHLDEVNMVTYGDGVADIDISALVNFHQQHGKILTITGVRPQSRFGEIVTHGDRVESFSEKGQSLDGWVNGGFMVFNRELVDYISDDPMCDLETCVIPALIEDDQVMVYKHSGSWACVDHERDLVYLNGLIAQGKAFWEQ